MKYFVQGGLWGSKTGIPGSKTGSQKPAVDGSWGIPVVPGGDLVAFGALGTLLGRFLALLEHFGPLEADFS